MTLTNLRRLIAAYQEGASLREVGVLVGVTYERVRQLLKREGIPRRPRGWSMSPLKLGKDQRREMLEALTTGTPITSLAQQYGIHRGTVRKYAHDAGVQRPRRKLKRDECGTLQRYRHGGCRCEACRAANARYCRPYKMKQYYRRKAEGVCVTCGKCPAVTVRTQCLDCSEKLRSRRCAG